MDAKTFSTPNAVAPDAATGSWSAGLREIVSELARSIPNRAVAVIVALGFLFEMVALFQVRQPLLVANWRLAGFTLAFVFWFWLTAGFLLHAAARRGIERQGKTSPRSLIVGAMSYITLGAIVAAYAISWGIFMKTSQFATWELWRFSLANFGELTKYVTDAEPVQAVYGSITIVASLIAFRLGQIKLGDRDDAYEAGPIFTNRIWFLATTLMLSTFAIVKHQPSLEIAEQDMQQLTRSLNPSFTLWSTTLASLSHEPFGQPFTDLSELTPLSVGWSPARKPIAPAINGQQPITAGELPSIIVIQVESLRSDVVHLRHQGREVMPHLNRLANDSLVWRNAHSQSTHSDYADPCIVSSLYPLRTRHHHYYSLDDPWPKKLSYDCLKQAGYATATISSQNEMWGRMEHFLDSPNLDFFYHPERYADEANAQETAQDPGFHGYVKNGVLKAGKFTDRHTASVATDWIKKNAATGRPFLLNMNLQSSHFPYLIPKEASQPFQPCDFGSQLSFAHYPLQATPIVRNAYYNALHEIDKQLGRIVAALEAADLTDRTMLIVLGENGEAFHENGQVCHANKPYNATTNVALVMHGPRWLAPGVEDYPIEHVDILPTLFRRIGLAPHPNFQGIDALATDRPQLSDRFLYFHTLSPFAECDGLQWAGRWKYLRDYQTNTSELYDIRSDPGETKNMVLQRPDLAQALQGQLTSWRNRQLAWYNLPQLYDNYYPPKPPQPSKEQLDVHWLD